MRCNRWKICNLFTRSAGDCHLSAFIEDVIYGLAAELSLLCRCLFRCFVLGGIFCSLSEVEMFALNGSGSSAVACC